MKCQNLNREEKTHGLIVPKMESEDDYLETKVHSSSRQGTIFSGYTVMTKSLLGSGVLSIAFACAKTGLIGGILMLILAAFLTWASLHVICRLGLEFPSNDITFYSITEHVIPRAKWVLDVAVIIDCIGSAICFVQAIGSLLGAAYQGIFGTAGMSERVLVIIIQIIVVLLLFPLCLMKDISDTTVANLVGIACLSYVTILAMVYTDLSHVTEDLMRPMDGLHAVSAFPIMIFAFACQQNVLSVVSEMNNPTMRKLDIVTSSSILTGLIMYLPVMILPYLTFGRSNPKAHTFFALLPDTAAVRIGYICAAVAIGISFVLVIHPTRRSIMSLKYGSDLPFGKRELKMRVMIVTLTVLLCLGVAIAAGDSLGSTVEFTGLLGANTCGFVMPFMLYLFHFGFDRRSLSSVTVAAMLAFSIALYPLGITASIMGIIDSK